MLNLQARAFPITTKGSPHGNQLHEIKGKKKNEIIFLRTKQKQNKIKWPTAGVPNLLVNPLMSLSALL